MSPTPITRAQLQTELTARQAEGWTMVQIIPVDARTAATFLLVARCP